MAMLPFRPPPEEEAAAAAASVVVAATGSDAEPEQGGRKHGDKESMGSHGAEARSARPPPCYEAVAAL